MENSPHALELVHGVSQSCWPVSPLNARNASGELRRTAPRELIDKDVAKFAETFHRKTAFVRGAGYVLLLERWASNPL